VSEVRDIFHSHTHENRCVCPHRWLQWRDFQRLPGVCLQLGGVAVNLPLAVVVERDQTSPKA
jgi:hypothetical protein